MCVLPCLTLTYTFSLLLGLLIENGGSGQEVKGPETSPISALLQGEEDLSLWDHRFSPRLRILERERLQRIASPVKAEGRNAAKRGSRLRIVIWISEFLLLLHFSTHWHT